VVYANRHAIEHAAVDLLEIVLFTLAVVLFLGAGVTALVICIRHRRREPRITLTAVPVRRGLPRSRPAAIDRPARAALPRPRAAVTPPAAAPRPARTRCPNRPVRRTR
jgi:hypothetical protein